MKKHVIYEFEPGDIELLIPILPSNPCVDCNCEHSDCSAKLSYDGRLADLRAADLEIIAYEFRNVKAAYMDAKDALARYDRMAKELKDSVGVDVYNEITGNNNFED